MDHFSRLGLPVRLELEAPEIEEAWRRATKVAHPDSHAATEQPGPESTDLASLHQARETLLDPTSRLGEWLRLISSQATAPAAISSELMDVFTQLGPRLAHTDALLGQHQKAGSGIARAVLARPLVEAQLSLQESLREIQELRQARIAPFAEWDGAAATGPFAAAHRALHDLKFLRKWEREVSERLIQLLAT